MEIDITARSRLLGVAAGLIALASSEVTVRAQPSLQRGVVIDTVSCLASPQHSYALYLPRNYAPDLKWPVLYIFEPAARGALPVERFSYGAEKYGYIVLGSNDARNGPWQPVFDALNAMAQDIEHRASIDPARIYTAGFSGGARAAVTAAVLTDQVAGVIGCGGGEAAAFPVIKGLSFDFVGVVGNRDMNFAEMRRFSARLTELRYRNKMIMFEGGHQWPAPEVLEKALEWLEIQAIYRGLKNRDRHFLDTVLAAQMSQADQFRDAGELVQAYELYSAIEKDFQSLRDIAPAHRNAVSLSRVKQVRASLNLRERIEKQEAKIVRKLSGRLGRLDRDDFIKTGKIRDEGWWRKEISDLREKQQSAPSAEESDAYARVFDWLWRHCSEQTSVYFDQTGLVKSIMLVQIWLMVSPDHPYPNYQLGRLYAVYGWTDLALTRLRTALELGLRNADRIATDPFWDLLRQHPEFLALTANLNQ